MASQPQLTEELFVTAEDGVATLTLNRPNQFNALSSGLIGRLQAELDRIAQTPSVRVVVIAANGRGFCAGHDLREIQALASVERVEAMFLACSRMMTTLGQIPQPVIAKVQGVATAAGCQLVAACDLAVCADAAQFGTPGVNLGAFCSTPSVALGRAVGRKHAMEMLLTGQLYDAQHAFRIGLVNKVVAAAQLTAEVDALARLIASKSAQALASGKRVFYRQLDLGLDEAYRVASHAIACDFASEDGREGVSAFLEKRPARWPDRH